MEAQESQPKSETTKIVEEATSTLQELQIDTESKPKQADDKASTTASTATEKKEMKQPEEEAKSGDDPDAKTVVISKNANNLRIAMLGNVDAGKSTLSGILTSAPGTLDDGNGSMRSKVFNFKHEQNNGRTSSIAHEIIGFDGNGE